MIMSKQRQQLVLSSCDDLGPLSLQNFLLGPYQSHLRAACNDRIQRRCFRSKMVSKAEKYLRDGERLIQENCRIMTKFARMLMQYDMILAGHLPRMTHDDDLGSLVSLADSSREGMPILEDDETFEVASTASTFSVSEASIDDILIESQPSSTRNRLQIATDAAPVISVVSDEQKDENEATLFFRGNECQTCWQDNTLAPTRRPSNSTSDSKIERCLLPTSSKTGLSRMHLETKSKKETRGRKKKAKGMPRRPLSAYNLFFRMEREKIAKKRGSISYVHMAKLVGKSWKQLSEEDKMPFKEGAAKEMSKYRQVMRIHKQSTRVGTTLVPYLARR